MDQRIWVVDSHTEGEPTRVVVDGAPDLGSGSAQDRLRRLQRDHPDFRPTIVNEPRGHDAVVGALVCEPEDPEAAAQLIFFNNVGYLGMCVHGAIGVATTLAWIGDLEPGAHRFETPVGDIDVALGADGVVAVRNVLSYRSRQDVDVFTDRFGRVVGDIAWGGNWFFLIGDHGQRIDADNLEALTDYAWQVRRALRDQGVTGDDGAEVDHVELFGPPQRSDADSKNFVLCPGREYDRSPCGTGTSAKMACLWADGALAPGATWRQESIIGSLFTGEIDEVEGGVLPTISGRAWITCESELILQSGDPFVGGIAR